jgi:hypothetical protein
LDAWNRPIARPFEPGDPEDGAMAMHTEDATTGRLTHDVDRGQARALGVTAPPPARTTFAPFAYVVFIVVLLAIAFAIALFASG